jgi:Trypsin-like peptidase domain
VRGWVLTNAHVASRSYSDITVGFREQKSIPAERVYVDPYLDVAIIAYDPDQLKVHPKAPELECAATPAVGHPVGAFGHPWGFRFTGTRGIASARTSRLGPDMLQTDAPINSGNSGGPLISLETGLVLGLNAASIRKDRADGLSFAVPMPLICTVLDLLRQGNNPSPPAPIVDFAVDANGERTLVVASSRLPAGSVDLRVADEIVAAGPQDASVKTESELIDQVRGTLDNVSLRVRRNGAELSLRGPWPPSPLVTQRRALWINGAMFGDTEPQISSLVAGSPALMVHHIEPGTEAEGAEIEAFDLLVLADGKAVHSLQELETVAKRAAAADRELELLLLRLGSENHELFLHQRRYLAATDIERVGPPSR